MFDRVAPKYDTVNLLISLGQARGCAACSPALRAHPLPAQTTLWRVLALAFLPRLFRRDAAVLDVGCGALPTSLFCSSCAADAPDQELAG